MNNNELYNKYLVNALKFHFSSLTRTELSNSTPLTDEDWLCFYNSDNADNFQFCIWAPYEGFSLEDVLGMAAAMAESFYALGKQYDDSNTTGDHS